MLHGIELRLKPTAETKTDAGDAADPNVPFEFTAALERFAKAKIVPRYVAADVLDLVRDLRLAEMRKFMGTISRQEYDWYL
jgi:glutamine synthetase